MTNKIDIENILKWRNSTTNILCHNPSEENIKEINIMSLKELAKKLNYRFYIFRKNNFKDLIGSYEIDGQPVFTFVFTKHTKIIVNPYLFKPKHKGALSVYTILFNK